MEWPQELVAEALGKAAREVVSEGFTIAPEYEEENIHGFRVAVKKLRALLRLSEAGGAEVPELPKKFRQLYRLSGAIRDAQLMTHKAQKAEPPVPEYVDWLAGRKEEAQQSYSDFYTPEILAKLERRLKKMEPMALSVAVIQTFFADRMAEVQTILARDVPSEEELHEIRKKAKDLHYISKTVKDLWPEGLEAAGIAEMMKPLEKLSEHAGDFNDQHNALLSLAAFMEEKGETEGTKALQEQWEAKKATEREKLLEEIKAFGA